MNKVDKFLNLYRKGKVVILRNIKFFNIKNKIVKNLAYREYCYNKLYKQYKYVLKKDYELKERENADIIWTCWFQGIENAPLLVKKCLDSMKKHIRGKKIIIITEKNYNQYVTIPDYIIKKWKKGIISYAHFSDLIRLELLNKYGGLWLDSTIYLTDDILFENPDFSLFVFQNVQLNTSDMTSVIASNWLIYSCKSNPILLTSRDLLFEYWKKNNKTINYNIFHLFFTMAAKKYKDIWDEMPIFNNINPHMLQFELLNNFKLKRWNQLKKMSPIHKLNHRIDEKDMGNDRITYYKYIINDETTC